MPGKDKFRGKKDEGGEGGGEIIIAIDSVDDSRCPKGAEFQQEGIRTGERPNFG